MDAYYCDQFVLPLPEGHRFPMRKYSLLRERLVLSKVLEPAELHIPAPALDSQILLVHAQEYLEKVKAGTLSPKEIRRIGFPWSLGMVERSRRSVGGTIAACRSALAGRLAVNLAGGTHHAFVDFGAGFCVFNDVAIAIRTMQSEGAIQTAVVFDGDVHQGDGTASLFAGDRSVFTFSIHGAKNFPFRKQASDLDIALPDGAEDDAFLDGIRKGLNVLLANPKPAMAVFLAGADPYVGDRLGNLAVTKLGLAERDRQVIGGFVKQVIPLVVVMGGGYAKPILDTVDIHLETIRIAKYCAENA